MVFLLLAARAGGVDSSGGTTAVKSSARDCAVSAVAGVPAGEPSSEIAGVGRSELRSKPGGHTGESALVKEVGVSSAKAALEAPEAIAACERRT
jgi:hypothetical protein